jgi:hypothetical protein
MTGRAEFDAEEWDAVLEGPTIAGVLVMSAERGGAFREAIAMAKVFAEARGEHGGSELLDEIVAERPEMPSLQGGSSEEQREQALGRVRAGIAAVRRKASEDELSDYRRFVADVARRVAEAKKERGQSGSVSEAEQQVLGEIKEALA